MRFIHLKTLLLAAALLACGNAGAQTPALTRAEWREHLRAAPPPEGPALLAPAPEDAVEALDIDPNIVVSASYNGHSSASSVRPELGVIRPVAGNSMLLLSSGVAGAGTPPYSYPEPGTSFGLPGNDLASWTLRIAVPPGANRLSFDFNFMSSEYPDFIGSNYNDEFEAILTTSLGSANIARDGFGSPVSVNNAFFYGADDLYAGGSGYDIYCPDPSGIDTEFPGGLPDAGLTRFQHVEVAIPEFEIITLEFRIFDRGDDIFDSQVIVDNLRIGGLEIVDARPDYFGGAYLHSQIVDPDDLVYGGERRIGTVCDGTSRLLFRYRAGSPGTVTIALTDPIYAGADNGTMFAVNSTQTSIGGVISTRTLPTSAGDLAFVGFTPPNTLIDTMSGNIGPFRELQVQLTYSPDDGTSSRIEQHTVRLYRTPVVFVHGLRSGPSMWNHPRRSALLADWGITARDIDYQDTHTARLDQNWPKLRDQTAAFLASYRDNGIACSQACVVAHSMGGVLARCWRNDPAFVSDQNFGEGYIHQLITVDTPHSGSEMPEYLLELLSLQASVCTSIAMNLLVDQIQDKQGPIDLYDGAHVDLVPGSEALDRIGTTTGIPSHAIVGVGGGSDWPLEFRLAWPPVDDLTWLNVVEDVVAESRSQGGCFGDLRPFTPAIFGGDQHDVIVTATSQRGGLSAPYITENPGDLGVHTWVAGQDDFWAQATEMLLLGPDAGNMAPGFPAPLAKTNKIAATTGSASVARLRASPFVVRPLPTKSLGGLTVLEPSSGAEFSSGDRVAIEVELLNGTPSILYFVSRQAGVVAIDPATGTAEYVLPEGFNGPLDFKVYAWYPNGWAESTSSRQIVVRPNSALDAIRVSPDERILPSPGAGFQVRAYGDFVDGISRDLTSPATGTTYLSDNQDVVTVDARGWVRSIGAGISTIVVQNGSHQSTLRVQVLDGVPNMAPTVDIGGPYTICVGDTLCLDATNAIDPDNPSVGALAFNWDLDGDGHFGDSISATPCLIAATATTFQVALKLTDVSGATTIAYAEVSATQCRPIIEGMLPPDAGPGDNAIIFGFGFSSDPGIGNRSTDAHHVSINGQRFADAMILVWTDEAIEVLLPSGINGGEIRVTSGGTASEPFLWRTPAAGCLWTDATPPPLDNPTDGHGVAWGDFDNDGDDDLFLANAGDNALLRNDGGGSFTRLPNLPWGGGDSRGAAWADYDNDGDLDLYVVNWGAANRLYRNDGGGSFVDVTDGDVGCDLQGNNVAWADYDNDGDLDVFITNFDGPNKLLNNDGGVFSLVNSAAGFTDKSRGCAWGDYDGDMDPDLYVSVEDGPNRLFRNDGGVLVDVTTAPLDDRGYGKGVAWADYDNDGDLDLYLVNRNSANRLFNNDGGVFTNVADAVTGDEGDGRACGWGDYDNDGWLDLYVTNYSGANRLFQNLHGAAFADTTCGDLQTPITAWGMGWSDYDNDGDLDLYVSNHTWQGLPNHMFRNDLISTKSWLQVQLVGSTSNRYGVGAKVVVQGATDEPAQLREVSAGSGYLSQASVTTQFGLGTVGSVDVTIYWPSGVVQHLADQQVNQRLVVAEAAGASGVGDIASPLTYGVSCHPNPFNPQTNIEFSMPQAGSVSLQVHDLTGRLVRTLIAGTNYDAGIHAVPWNGTDAAGRKVASGVYFYRFVSGAHQQTGRMMLLK